MTTILVIPAEGDSVETEKWYVEDWQKLEPEARIEVFEFNKHYWPVDPLMGEKTPEICPIEVSILWSVQEFFEKHPDLEHLEIHAQGGFGTAVAWKICWCYPKLVDRVFFIGGAPCEAMNGLQKWFHCSFSKFWYLTRIPFFADDPNPFGSQKIDEIKASSTAAMRADPKTYRDQLVFIGHWRPSPPHLPYGLEGWFVPNGETVRAAWLDNSYNNEVAIQLWANYGIRTTKQPGNNFSFYSLMPVDPLYDVIACARIGIGNDRP